MKRCSSVLVAYSSSDEDEKPSVKKRKLPSLPPVLTIPAPIDDPALHQGRLRSKPHVEGQFVAHVYVSLVVHRDTTLHKLVEDVLMDARKLSPTLADFWSAGEQPKKNELHISLSRPTYLRAHQREDLKRAVKRLSQQFPPFVISFATFTELINDEHTRTFLAMEVGAGHHELRAMSDALTPALHAIRQKEFYLNPRFHASIAWALLDRPCSETRSNLADGKLDSAAMSLASTSPESVPEVDFPTIPHLPNNLVAALNDRHGGKLSSTKTGIFDVSEITVKIGKDIYTWQLSAL